MNHLSPEFGRRRLRIGIGLTGVLLAAACASTPPPTASLAAARSAIAEAEQADAGRYSAPELGEARDKLAAANADVEKKSMFGAQRLAEESRVDALLASAKTKEARATAINDEMIRSNDTLIEEMQRNSGAPQ